VCLILFAVRHNLHARNRRLTWISLRKNLSFSHSNRQISTASLRSSWTILRPLLCLSLIKPLSLLRHFEPLNVATYQRPSQPRIHVSRLHVWLYIAQTAITTSCTIHILSLIISRVIQNHRLNDVSTSNNHFIFTKCQRLQQQLLPALRRPAGTVIIGANEYATSCSPMDERSI
jgi:hypothetical protein